MVIEGRHVMKTKVIAFYLPQFHTIPENDNAFGKGFTEWTNTKKAKPLFEGQYQPRTPLGENYYDLSDTSVMEWQSELAMKNGIYGFCYYHYWFGNGRKLLEKPVENMLKNKKVKIPFCICWANENWCKRWDGGNGEMIMKQDYGNKESWMNHIQYLIEFFKDERYITLDGEPILVIYKPEIISHFSEMMDVFRCEVVKAGFKGLKVVAQYPDVYFMQGTSKKSIDYYIHFEPKFTQEYVRQSTLSVRQKRNEEFRARLKKKLQELSLDKLIVFLQKTVNKKNTVSSASLKIRDYDEDWVELLSIPINKNEFAGAFVDWDNTPRNSKGLAYKGSTPEKFGSYFKKLVELVEQSDCQNIIFMNAWNEWAEGAYLEPDEKYAYAYLEQVKKALEGR